MSRYKVATDSWRQLDEIARRTERPPLCRDPGPRRQAPADREAGNTRDLAAQTIGLCLLDPEQENARRADRGERPRICCRSSGRMGTGRSSSTRPTRSPRCRPARASTPWPSPGCKPDRPRHAPGHRGPPDPPAGVRRLVRRQPLRAVPHAVPGNPVGTDGALVALSQSRAASRSDGMVPSAPSPESLRTDSPATSRSATSSESGTSPPPSFRRGIVAQLGHEAPMVRYAACRTLGRIGDEPGDPGLDRSASATRARSCAGPRPRRCG